MFTPAEGIASGLFANHKQGGYLGQVATKCWIPHEYTTSFKYFNSRSPHVARDDIFKLQILLPNWYFNPSTGAETNGGGIITYSASIEYPAGAFTQLTFSGAAYGACAAGQNLMSDACKVFIPNGAQFWVRVNAAAATGFVYHGIVVGPTNFSINDSNNGQLFNYSNSPLSDLTLGGTITNTNTPNTPTNPGFMPLAILSQTVKSSVFILGDSIGFGYGDTFDSSGDLGIIARSIGPIYGYINASRFGDNANRMKTNFTKTSGLIQYCSHVYSELGVNDLIGNANTSSALTSSLQSLYAFASKKIIIQTTITPVSTSTDAWATDANQTANTNNSLRVTFNSALRTTGITGAQYVCDIASILEPNTDTGKWIANGTANAYTVDGTNPTKAGYLLVSNAAIANLTPVVNPPAPNTGNTIFVTLNIPQSGLTNTNFTYANTALVTVTVANNATFDVDYFYS